MLNRPGWPNSARSRVALVAVAGCAVAILDRAGIHVSARSPLSAGPQGAALPDRLEEIDRHAPSAISSRSTAWPRLVRCSGPTGCWCTPLPDSGTRARSAGGGSGASGLPIQESLPGIFPRAAIEPGRRRGCAILSHSCPFVASTCVGRVFVRSAPPVFLERGQWSPCLFPVRPQARPCRLGWPDLAEGVAPASIADPQRRAPAFFRRRAGPALHRQAKKPEPAVLRSATGLRLRRDRPSAS